MERRAAPRGEEEKGGKEMSERLTVLARLAEKALGNEEPQEGVTGVQETMHPSPATSQLSSAISSASLTEGDEEQITDGEEDNMGVRKMIRIATAQMGPKSKKNVITHFLRHKSGQTAQTPAERLFHELLSQPATAGKEAAQLCQQKLLSAELLAQAKGSKTKKQGRQRKRRRPEQSPTLSSTPATAPATTPKQEPEPSPCSGAHQQSLPAPVPVHTMPHLPVQRAHVPVFHHGSSHWSRFHRPMHEMQFYPAVTFSDLQPLGMTRNRVPVPPGCEAVHRKRLCCSSSRVGGGPSASTL